jgi:hypothetical protein
MYRERREEGIKNETNYFFLRGRRRKDTLKNLVGSFAETSVIVAFDTRCCTPNAPRWACICFV